MYETSYFFFLALALLHLLHVESMCGFAGFNFLAWEFLISVLWVWGLDSYQIPWWLRCHWSVLETLQSWTIPWACRSFFPHSASAWNTPSSLLFLAVFCGPAHPVHILFPQKVFLYAPFYQRLLVPASVVIYCLTPSPHITIWAVCR